MSTHYIVDQEQGDRHLRSHKTTSVVAAFNTAKEWHDAEPDTSTSVVRDDTWEILATHPEETGG